jgi:hypothetical protein
MSDNAEMLASLERSKQSFERVLAGLQPSPFDVLLKYIQALHNSVLNALSPDSEQVVSGPWVGLATETYFRLRNAIVDSYRRRSFAPYDSGRSGTAAARLYRALGTEDRRVAVLDALLLVSRVTWTCELLRANPGFFPLELALAEAARHAPALVLPRANALCRWDTLPQRFSTLRADNALRLQSHGVTPVDLSGLVEQLRLEAETARFLIGTGSPPVTHALVIGLWERLRAFLVSPAAAPWRLSRLVDYEPGISLHGIIRTLASHEMRLESDDDGRLVPFLSTNPRGLRSLFIERNGFRYLVLLPSTDCLLDNFPTAKDIARFENDPAAFLLGTLDRLASSGLARDVDSMLTMLHDDKTQLVVGDDIIAASTTAAAAMTSRAVAKWAGAPDEVTDLIEPFALVVLAKIVGRHIE